jgi:hypothetical protein
MKIKAFLLFFVILFALGYQYIFSVTPLYEVPKLLSNMRAKEFCSCYFLLKNSKDYCLEKVKKSYPLFGVKINESSVEFKNPISSSRAYLRSKQLGCTLE